VSRIAVVLVVATFAGRAPSRQESAPLPGVLLPSSVDRVLGDLLVPHPSRITRLSSSHDPSGGNRDADTDLLARDGDWVEMFVAEGEGRITRLWMNADYEHDIPSDWRELWIVADGATVFRGDPLDWFGGKAGPVPPMVMDQSHSSGAFVSWVPIAYRAGAKLLVRGDPHYFQVSHREGPGSANGASIASIERFMTDRWWTRVRSPETRARAERRAPVTIATGPALVTELALASPDLARARLRIGDGAPFPATYLFAFGPPRDGAWPAIASSLVRVDPAAHLLATRTPLPLRAGESIVVEADAPIDFAWSATLAADHTTHANGARVVTQYRDRHAPGAMTTTTLFDAKGPLTLVSIVEELADGRPGDRAFLEGDDMLRTDGMQAPLFLGTGTEDYFNGGWYFLGVHSNPMSGLSRFVVTRDERGWGHALFEYSMHRHHVLDAPVARSGMQMGIEIGPDGSYAPMKVRSFALAYAFDGPRVIARRAFALGAGDAALGVADEWVESAIDAEVGAEPIRFGVRRGARTTTLRVECPKGERVVGALVVRTYDAASAPQRAAIIVGGRTRSAFFEPRRNPHRRLAQDERYIDLDRDCDSGTLAIDVRSADAEWTESAYEVVLFAG
jgi:hypothetical protein